MPIALLSFPLLPHPFFSPLLLSPASEFLSLCMFLSVFVSFFLSVHLSFTLSLPVSLYVCLSYA